MTDRRSAPRGHSADAVAAAIRASWSADRQRWASQRPAMGQRDVSSWVAWEYLGADPVLSEVLVDGRRTEHHDWNRIDGRDLELPREQFDGREEVVESSVHAGAELDRRRGEMRPELATRISVLRDAVAARLAAR